MLFKLFNYYINCPLVKVFQITSINEDNPLFIKYNSNRCKAKNFAKECRLIPIQLSQLFFTFIIAVENNVCREIKRDHFDFFFFKL